MNMDDAINILEKQMENPLVGLPEEIFYFISKLTPMVNVDLLIKDESGRTLLAWRDDQFVNKGWHLPGGIVRFKEKLEDRVKKVAQTEIGAEIEFNKDPIAVNQLMVERDVRGHFISFLYECKLPSTFIPLNEGIAMDEQGYLMWHDTCPSDLIKVHDIYRKYI